MAPVSGSFRTASGNDTTYPDSTYSDHTFPMTNFLTKSGLMFLRFDFTEALNTFEIILTESVTQAVKKYCFFNLPAGGPNYFFLNGATPDKNYNVKWIMVDMGGNMASETVLNANGTPSYSAIINPIFSEGETPPNIVSNTIASRTDTGISMRVVTDQECANRAFMVHYRIVGDTQWAMASARWFTGGYYRFTMSGLTPGQQYEYQYVLMYSYGNQLITEWATV